MYVQCNFEACTCNHSCSGKAMSITYSQCVFLALGAQHEIYMRLIVICGLSGLQHISKLSHKLRDFRKKKN